ncbi:MAG: GPP34 family phosphoprotein [Candidatus Kapabacteria bacterium]|jgi:uncharacterized membrane protein YgcG|nr:GPP34 family phosphoprotein [Candidatus Kapabacteria bacterium]
MTSPLALYEQVQLLSMKDDTGLVHNFDVLNATAYAVAGAVIMDLSLGGWLRFDNEGYCQIVPDKKAPDDAVLRAVLQRIAKSETLYAAKDWIPFIQLREHPERAAITSLIAKGVVRLERKWGFFSKKRYPLKNVTLKKELLSSLTDALKSHSQPAFRTIVLLGLVYSARLSPYIFPAQFRSNPDALYAAIKATLKKKPVDNGVEGALMQRPEDDTDDTIYVETVDSFDAFYWSVDSLYDAVSESISDAESNDSWGGTTNFGNDSDSGGGSWGGNSESGDSGSGDSGDSGGGDGGSD